MFYLNGKIQFTLLPGIFYEFAFHRRTRRLPEMELRQARDQEIQVSMAGSKITFRSEKQRKGIQSLL
jgi:hypothetical protein